MRRPATGRMQDWVAHRYFDTSDAILAATVKEDLPQLRAAERGLLERVDPA